MSGHTEVRLSLSDELENAEAMRLVGHSDFPVACVNVGGHVGGIWVWAAHPQERARRIVACWNACSGLPTEHLEAGILNNPVDCTDRYELLAALREAASLASDGMFNVPDPERCGALYDRLTALLSKHTPKVPG